MELMGFRLNGVAHQRTYQGRGKAPQDHAHVRPAPQPVAIGECGGQPEEGTCDARGDVGDDRRGGLASSQASGEPVDRWFILREVRKSPQVVEEDQWDTCLNLLRLALRSGLSPYRGSM